MIPVALAFAVAALALSAVALAVAALALRRSRAPSAAAVSKGRLPAPTGEASPEAGEGPRGTTTASATAPDVLLRIEGLERAVAAAALREAAASPRPPSEPVPPAPDESVSRAARRAFP